MFDNILAVDSRPVTDDDLAKIRIDGVMSWAVSCGVVPVTVLPDTMTDFARTATEAEFSRLLGIGIDEIELSARCGRVFLFNVTPHTIKDPPIAVIFDHPDSTAGCLRAYARALFWLGGAMANRFTTPVKEIWDFIADIDNVIESLARGAGRDLYQDELFFFVAHMRGLQNMARCWLTDRGSVRDDWPPDYNPRDRRIVDAPMPDYRIIQERQMHSGH